MKKYCCFLVIAFSSFMGIAQENIDRLDLTKIKEGQVKTFWLEVGNDGFNQPLTIPIIVVKGRETGPVLGLTSAIHGNELNGIAIIHQLIKDLNPETLSGIIVAVPGINRLSIEQHQRLFVDNQDLNRLFPGKKKGNRSQQYVWHLNTKILSKLDFLVDLHTASFGRANSLYVRGDFSVPIIKKLALVLDADILLNSSGAPSAGKSLGENRTLRGEAAFQGVPALTIECGNPQVFQKEIIRRGISGLKNLMIELEMLSAKKTNVASAIVCKKSYWMYTDAGGILDVIVDLTERVQAGQLVAVLRDSFGKDIKKYFAPEEGIIIGKSTNPINQSGGRIIHLGILENNKSAKQ